MGLFDMFTREGKLARHARRMADPYTQPEDREASLRWLTEDGSDAAILGLLGRFDVAASNQLKDRTEKDQVMEVLVDMGPRVLPALKTWFGKCRIYAFPLRLLERLEGRDAAVAAAIGVLESKLGRSAFEPERRKELITWLAEHKHGAVEAAVVGFLKDMDEEVRYVAAEALVTQGGEVGREALLGVLANPKEESTRLKHRLAQVVAQRGWSVQGLGLEASPPHGYAVHEGRLRAV